MLHLHSLRAQSKDQLWGSLMATAKVQVQVSTKARSRGQLQHLDLDLDLDLGLGLALGAGSSSGSGAGFGIEVITRDVAVIGGGSTGTFAAIKLRDLNHTVVVIEKEDHLGGHVNTYTDVETGQTLDYTVVVFHDIPVVRNYFSRFHIPLAPIQTNGQTVLPIDFTTGLPNVAGASSPNATQAALQVYAAQLAKYPYLSSGFFELPEKIPEDLLIPFGDFVAKYKLDAMVPLAFQYCQGFGDLLSLPSLYVLKFFDLSVLQGIQAGFLTTARHDNIELWEKAQAELGHDALTSSRVIGVSRASPDSNGYSTILVTGPSGPKIIQAREILYTAPPRVQDNLIPFSLDAREQSILSRFTNHTYWAGLIRNSGVPPGTAIWNSNPTQPYNLAELPGPYNLVGQQIPGLAAFYYAAGSTPGTQPSDDEVKADVLRKLRNLQLTSFGGMIAPSGGPNGTNSTNTTALGPPEVLDISNHCPFEFTVEAEAIAEGFYRDLASLQGYRGLWWTGASFHVHDSSRLWAFTEVVVMQMVSALRGGARGKNGYAPPPPPPKGGQV
ncbi:Pyridine nucleotide-disulfide oxidoreductase [Macrophomina phaseolina MS6]|uniref:Pyridine nucleotide-disulfide oxidoreductase n=1 Tax=Macrophomina phaseolina (strain MS6) TaxID=1126212 RepID=K2RLY4_MACPH|nr:Pyridine nucleotide-disulfide oxidoreductase [Macrophomina phaseolina MS6]